MHSITLQNSTNLYFFTVQIEQASRKFLREAFFAIFYSVLSATTGSCFAALPNVSVDCEAELIDKLSTLLTRTYDAYNSLDKAEKNAVAKKCDEEASFYYKDTVEAKMANLRRLVDEMETLTAREYWPMPTYGDIMFRV